MIILTELESAVQCQSRTLSQRFNLLSLHRSKTTQRNLLLAVDGVKWLSSAFIIIKTDFPQLLRQILHYLLALKTWTYASSIPFIPNTFICCCCEPTVCLYISHMQSVSLLGSLTIVYSLLNLINLIEYLRTINILYCVFMCCKVPF